MRNVTCALVAGLLTACSTPRETTFAGGDHRSDDDDAVAVVDDLARVGGGDDDAAGTGGNDDDANVNGGGTDAEIAPLPAVVDIVAHGAPSDSASRFGAGEDPAHAPRIVYPNAGVIVPHNLSGLEVHYLAGSDSDALFELDFAGAHTTVRVFTRCNTITDTDGCVFALDDATFATVARAASGTGEVSLTVRGTPGTGTGGPVGTSPARTLGITDEDLRGGIYYWNAGTGNIMRYEFGLANAHPETYIRGNPPLECVGCHALSRDGRRLSVGTGTPAPASGRIRDVATGTLIGTTYGANFATFSSDGRLLLTSTGYTLTLRDSANGTETAGLPANFVGTQPDWSPGNDAVYAVPPPAPINFGGTIGHPGPASLNVMTWNGTAFGAARTLVRSTGENNYYPTYSPDGAWVAFNRGEAMVSSENNIGSHLWVVDANGTSPPVHLAAADETGDLGNSWPKWAPFQQMYQGEPLYWLTFTSRRDYGIRLEQQGYEVDNRHAQLWMAAFRPMRAGTDPSVPAFWLPVQDTLAGNHIAQWTTTVRRRSCGRDGDCGSGESCRMLALAGSGVCVGM